MDWEDFFYGEILLLFNMQVNVSGGFQKIQFFVFGSIFFEDGIMKNIGFDCYFVCVNVDYCVSDCIKVSLNIIYLKSDNDCGFIGNQNNIGGSIGYVLVYMFFYVDLFLDVNGNYFDNFYFNDNLVVICDLGVNNQEIDCFIFVVLIDIDLYQLVNFFLKFKVNGGIDYFSGNFIVYFLEILQY